MSALQIYSLVLSGVLGAMIGSFLNVVAYRLPLGLSLLYPGSRCPECLTPLGVTENIPVLGWIWLSGRCKHCQTPISIRYPLVEAATALLFVAVTWVYGPGPATVGYCLLVSLLMALSLIDLDTFELPHTLTLPGIYLGLLWQSGVVFGQRPLIGLLEGLLGYGVAVLLLDTIAWLGRIYLWFKEPTGKLLSWQPFAALGILGIGYFLGQGLLGMPVAGAVAFYGGVLLLWDTFFILQPTAAAPEDELDELVALGGGDVLLGGLLGAWLGWQGLLVALATGFLLGAIGGGVMRLSGRLGAGERFAFGPFLALGGVVSLLVGNRLVESYLQILGIS